jgi:DNA-binding transcriptional regulator YhcF (GntR family)
MKMLSAEIFFNQIYINEFLTVPKYVQVANHIIELINTGQITANDSMPSINVLTYHLDIGRDTAEKTYKYLKKSGYINSIPGKGFFVKERTQRPLRRIFLLFNKLSAHKKLIYDAFVSAIEPDIIVDFFVYNDDFLLYKTLLNSKTGYQYYVIIPHMRRGEEYVNRLLNAIPKDKLLILDKHVTGIEGRFASVFENFKKDIYKALVQALEPLKKYHTIKVIGPDAGNFPLEIFDGLKAFCKQFGFISNVVDDISKEQIQPGEVYISLREEDLILLVEKLKPLNLLAGRQVGVISYNETPLKRIILNGITTFSTDFKQMGLLAAQQIRERSFEHLEVPFHLTLRGSL